MSTDSIHIHRCLQDLDVPEDSESIPGGAPDDAPGAPQRGVMEDVPEDDPEETAEDATDGAAAGHAPQNVSHRCYVMLIDQAAANVCHGCS